MTTEHEHTANESAEPDNTAAGAAPETAAAEAPDAPVSEAAAPTTASTELPAVPDTAASGAQAPQPAPGAVPAPPAPAVPAQPAAAQPVPGRPRPRTGPIVWGALILVFCAYVAVHAAGGSIDATTWLITTIIGLGALLLVVGVAVLARSGRADRR